MNPSRPPIHQIEDSMRPTWMAGDFGVVAIPLARQGTVVTGVDIPPISSPEPENVPPPKTSPLPSTKKMPSKLLYVHASFRKYLGSAPRGDFDGLFSLYPD
jgi:hypothetical protein